jgi:predicted amidohydrolase
MFVARSSAILSLMDDLFIPNLHQLGKDQGRGNLLGIEPYMTPWDYATRESFFERLKSYLVIAQREKWLNEKTIVVFPEYVGSGLVLAGEREEVYRSSTVESAARQILFHNLFKFITHWLKSRERGRAEAAFFRMKAHQMGEIYHSVFSQLARDFTTTIAAGSIVLPAPEISNGKLILTKGPLQNVSVIYQPDGTPYQPIIRKAFPTSRELPFTAPAPAHQLPAFQTPAGRLGLLICADSWFPQAYAPLNAQGINLLAVSSFNAFGMEKWNGPWHGYDGWPAPTDVDLNDIDKITEAQAWKKYSLVGRMRSSGAESGINVFLRGKAWDYDFGGWPATLIKNGDIFVEEQTWKAAMLSLWL